MRAVAAAALLAVGASPVFAADPSEKSQTQKSAGEMNPAQQPAAAATKVKAGELAANPSRYLGKSVTVTSQVATVYGSRMFTLDEDRIGARPDVLVLVPDHASVDYGNNVTVSGVVREFVWTDLRRDYEWFDLRPQFEVVLRSRPVIVATSVKSGDATELVGRAQQPTLDQLERQPGDYYGDFVSLRAPVGEIESPHVFTLDRGAGQPEVLVLIPAPKAGASLAQKTQVTVKGVVRPFFMSDLERDYDWFALDEDLVLKIEDRPVLVAESVRDAAGREFVDGGAMQTSSAKEPAANR
jgi:hypothetical protein